MTALGNMLMPQQLPSHPYVDNPFGVVGVIGIGFTSYDMFGASIILAVAATRYVLKGRASVTGVVLVVASSLAVIALLALAVSLVAFLIQTSRHKPTTRWAMATGAFLILTLLFGTISNAVSRQSGQRDTRLRKFHREFIGLCENV